MRAGMHVAVGIILIGILIAGGFLIRHLNSDAREIGLTNVLAMQGQSISTEEGCIACHTVDGSPGVGPSWLGMYERIETLEDGSMVLVDKEYFKESILKPNAKKVQGYPSVMLRYFLTDAEIDALFEFVKQLSDEQQ